MLQPSEIDIVIGRNIRIKREALRLSQGELGDRLSEPVSNQQISRYELGFGAVSAMRLVEIAAICKCSLTDLFEGVEQITAPMSKPELPQPIQARLCELVKALAMELGFNLQNVERSNGR